VTDDTDTPPTPGHVREWPGGISWIADPEDNAKRASHALATDAGVWVVDPVDTAGLDERLAALGEVAGVVVALDRHTRDAVAVARRHDVAVFLPEWMTLAREKLATDAETLGGELPGTTYGVHELIHTDEWEEAVLVDENGGTVVVPEALGTLPSFGSGDGLGLHPALDEAPDGLADRAPERVLVGHGESVHDGATAALRAGVGVGAD
jgi:hypothetical protein